MADRKREERDRDREKPSEWAWKRGIRVYNYALLGQVSDSEFELRIGSAIEEAYNEGARRGAATLEERLGA